MTLLKKFPILHNGWFVTATALFVVDRLCKYWSLRGHSYFVGEAVAFWYFRNTGIAFSLPLASAIFWPAAITIFVLLAVLFARAFRSDFTRAGLYWMVLLGANSNLMDRWYTGATSDYLIFFNRSAVNVADGMIIVALCMLCFAKPSRQVNAADS